ncbi:MAG TPA: hypothetical protein VFO17_03535 [Acidimicrobiia bacterium]|nr:hypothetical protein [Acidimicrobiia bacterium]
MTTTFTYPTRTEAQSTTTALTAAVALAAAIAGAALLGTIGIRAGTGAPDRPVDQVTQPITYPSIPEPISPSVNPAPTPRFGGGSVAFRF